jgi:hypothetical protein
LPDQGQPHRGVIHQRVPSHRGEEPDGDGDQRGQEERGQSQLEGGGQIAADHVEGGLAEVDGAAEVAPRQVGEKDAILHGERPVEPELGPHPEDLAARRIRRE